MTRKIVLTAATLALFLATRDEAMAQQSAPASPAKRPAATILYNVTPDFPLASDTTQRAAVFRNYSHVKTSDYYTAPDNDGHGVKLRPAPLDDTSPDTPASNLRVPGLLPVPDAMQRPMKIMPH